MAHPGQPQFSPAQEPGTVSPLDLPEMEKLLTKVGGQDDKPLKLSKSPSGALDLEQGCHSLPFKVVSEGHREASLPQASSLASSRRGSSIATTSYTQDREVPKDYLVLAITSCFCPIWPLNLIPLIFSIMSSIVEPPGAVVIPAALLSSEKPLISSYVSIHFTEAQSPARGAFPNLHQVQHHLPGL
ncbi:Tumor suppressor candidate 5, partial [Eschrichtius robustus]|nr:Tumor suppressor candidate 5 [Eschrichtius robustus]